MEIYPVNWKEIPSQVGTDIKHREKVSHLRLFGCVRTLFGFRDSISAWVYICTGFWSLSCISHQAIQSPNER